MVPGPFCSTNQACTGCWLCMCAHCHVPATHAPSFLLLPPQAGDQADGAMQTGTERSSAAIQQEARVLLDQAGTAQTVWPLCTAPGALAWLAKGRALPSGCHACDPTQCGLHAPMQAAEAAHSNMNCTNCSAALLYPVPDAADPPFPATALVAGMATIHLQPPLYNYKALQLWILR